MSTTLKSGLLTAVAWVATVIVDLFLLMVAAVALERASLSLAELGVVVVILLHGAVATAATGFVLYQTRSLTGGVRLLWLGGFALLQLGTWIVAALMTLLVMNR